MANNERYLSAKEIFAKYGVDTEAAIEKLSGVGISIHCWQLDDVRGFEGTGSLSGGIQTTSTSFLSVNRSRAHIGRFEPKSRASPL